MIRTSMITLIPKVWLCRGGYNMCAVTSDSFEIIKRIQLECAVRV